MTNEDGPRPRPRKQISPHGTRARYNRGCSCEDCRAANADYMAFRRAVAARENGTTTGEQLSRSRDRR